MKSDRFLQYFIASVLAVHGNCFVNFFHDRHEFHTHFPLVQRPRPTWGCIECTYANRATCCRYFQRCCSSGNFPNLGSCMSADFVSHCADKCTSDGQCPGGQKCCPPSNFVCQIPFGFNECPLSVSPTVILRPCDTGCANNEICCPNPRTPGCCVSRRGSGPIQPQNPINPG